MRSAPSSAAGPTCCKSISAWPTIPPCGPAQAASPSCAWSAGSTTCGCAKRTAAGTLNCVGTSLARADTDHLLHIAHENLAVANLARARSLDDGVDYLFRHAIVDHHFHFHFRQEVDHVLGATVQLGMTFLTAKTLHFRHGQARHVHIGQGLAYFVELEWFDDGGNLFHGYSLKLITCLTDSS